jgi:hypothetical protein
MYIINVIADDEWGGGGGGGGGAGYAPWICPWGINSETFNIDRSKTGRNVGINLKKTVITINHDQLKLCKDRDIPSWLTRCQHCLREGEHIILPVDRDLC